MISVHLCVLLNQFLEQQTSVGFNDERISWPNSMPSLRVIQVPSHPFSPSSIVSSDWKVAVEGEILKRTFNWCHVGAACYVLVRFFLLVRYETFSSGSSCS